MSEPILSVTYDQQKIVEQDKAGVGKYTLPASGKVMESDLEIELNVPKGVAGAPKLSSRKYAVSKVDDVDYVVQPIVENVEGYIDGGTQYGEPETIAVSDILGSTAKSISQNGRADVTAYRYADVNVPNTYTASDEGKVVSGGALVEQADLDDVDFGDNPTVDAYGKTASRHYEAIADAINTAKARGNAVTLEDVTINANGTTMAESGTAFKSVEVEVPNTYGYDDVGKVVSADFALVVQTAYPDTIDQSGTYDTTLYDSVTVAAPSGGGGYDSYETITGTLANLWGSLSFADVVDRVRSFSLQIGAYPVILYDASAIGAGSGRGVLFSLSSTTCMAMGADIASSTSRACTMKWDTNGLVSAYMEQNGTITDISQYASTITTTLYLPTEGGNT